MYIHASKTLVHIKCVNTFTFSKLGVELMAEHWLVWTKSCVQYQVIERTVDLQMVQDEQQVTSAGSAFVAGLQQTRKMHVLARLEVHPVGI